MATKLSDILNKESTGIMFPFSSNTPSTGVLPVGTTQQVYSASTDGIMTVQGKQYTGPNAIINYGSKEKGYPRNLKQIEKGMLPQFNQSTLPDVGKGTVETGTPTAPVTPPTEEVKTPEPVVDPCPTGFKLINGVCQRTQQGGNDRPTPKGKTVTNGIIEGYDRVSLTPGQTGAMNSRQMMELEKKYGADVASEIGLVNQKYDRGAQIKIITETINGKEVPKKNPDGTTQVKNIIAVSPTLPQALAEINVFSDLVEGLTKDVKGAVSDIITTLRGTKEAEVVKDSTQNTGTDTKTNKVAEKPTSGSTITNIDIANLSKDFGKLNSSIATQNQLFSEASKELEDLQNKFVKNKPRERIAKDKKAKAEKAIAAAQAQRDKLFNKSLEATKDQPLTDNEKKYLDSGNRKALAGESKNNKGNVDTRSGQVSGRENSGFGFKATSANYNKKTKTFDQRFK